MACGRDSAAGGADLADDVEVLLSDPLHERQPVQQILEAGGAEHHADDVGRVGLVGGDELLREHLLGVRLKRLELAETRAGGASSTRSLSSSALFASMSAWMRLSRRARRAMLASSCPIRPDAARTVPESEETRPWPAVIRCWSWPTLAALAAGELELRPTSARRTQTHAANMAPWRR